VAHLLIGGVTVGKTNDDFDAVGGFKVNGTALAAVSETLTNKTLTTPVVASLYPTTAKNKLVTVPTPGTTAGDTLASLTGSQTLTNKVLTTPMISSIYKDTAKTKLMTLPDVASDTLVALAAAQTLTNKVLTTPMIASMYKDTAKTKLVTVPDVSTAGDTLAALALAQTVKEKTLSSGCKWDTETPTTATALSAYKDSYVRNTTAGGTKTYNLNALVAGVRKRIVCTVASATAWVKIYSGSTAAATFDGTNRYVKFVAPGYCDLAYASATRYVIGGTTGVKAST